MADKDKQGAKGGDMDAIAKAAKSLGKEETEHASWMDEGIPDDFQRVNPEWGARLYCRPEAGLIVRGILIGSFTRRSGFGGDYFQIRVSLDVPARDGEKNEVICTKGSILCVDKRSSLEDLEDWTNKDFPVEVFIAFREKMPLASGQSWWRTDVGARQAPASLLRDMGIG